MTIVRSNYIGIYKRRELYIVFEVNNNMYLMARERVRDLLQNLCMYHLNKIPGVDLQPEQSVAPLFYGIYIHREQGVANFHCYWLNAARYCHFVYHL